MTGVGVLLLIVVFVLMSVFALSVYLAYHNTKNVLDDDDDYLE